MNLITSLRPRTSFIATVNPLPSVWRSGSALVSINEVKLRRAPLVLGWVTVSRFDPGASLLYFRHVTSHPGLLSLLPSVGRYNEYTSQRAVMLCGWAVKAGMACLQVKLCVAISERFGERYLKPLYKCPGLLYLLYSLYSSHSCFMYCASWADSVKRPGEFK